MSASYMINIDSCDHSQDILTPEMLTGQSGEHLTLLPDFPPHRLQPCAAQAFLSMSQAALLDGIHLCPASSFRDFSRQKMLWNEKFYGMRPVLDAQCHPLAMDALNDEQRCLAILRWSAVPGASRHHWGTDLDVYDAEALPDGAKLQLEPWEYAPDGYFSALTAWLDQHMEQFGFFRPFTADNMNGVAPEPWHLSYRAAADEIAQRLTPELLCPLWRNEGIAGHSWLCEHVDLLFERFILPPEQGV